MHIKLARITALCYLIKETDQMKVGISANNGAKVQLARYYFEVKINQKSTSLRQRKGKKIGKNTLLVLILWECSLTKSTH